MIVTLTIYIDYHNPYHHIKYEHYLGWHAYITVLYTYACIVTLTFHLDFRHYPAMVSRPIKYEESLLVNSVVINFWDCISISIPLLPKSVILPNVKSTNWSIMLPCYLTLCPYINTYVQTYIHTKPSICPTTLQPGNNNNQNLENKTEQVE